MRNSQWRTFWHVTAKPPFWGDQGPLTKFRMASHWTSLLIRILGARACPLTLSESAISFCFQDIWITNGWQDLLDQNWVVQCRTFMNNAYVHMSCGALLGSLSGHVSFKRRNQPVVTLWLRILFSLFILSHLWIYFCRVNEVSVDIAVFHCSLRAWLYKVFGTFVAIFS